MKSLFNILFVFFTTITTIQANGIETKIQSVTVFRKGVQVTRNALVDVSHGSQKISFYGIPKDIDQRDVYVVDPMLATGGSAIDAISQIKLRNPRKIVFMCIIAAPEGLEALKKAHPDVDIYCASLDEKLNDDAYIIPGLGDAGDRIFGTK